MALGGKRAGAGRRHGSKNKKTLEREAAAKLYEQMVRENLQPLFRNQLWLASGLKFVYRKEKHGTGASMRIEHVLLENPREIADALDIIANGDFQDDDEGFVYVTTTPPENRAIDSMLDRALGKAVSKLDVTSGGEKLPTPILANVLPSDDRA